MDDDSRVTLRTLHAQALDGIINAMDRDVRKQHTRAQRLRVECDRLRRQRDTLARFVSTVVRYVSLTPDVIETLDEIDEEHHAHLD